MRDRADNFVVIYTIENVYPMGVLYPMGVHTGDSINYPRPSTNPHRPCVPTFTRSGETDHVHRWCGNRLFATRGTADLFRRTGSTCHRRNPSRFGVYKPIMGIKMGKVFLRKTSNQVVFIRKKYASKWLYLLVSSSQINHRHFGFKVIQGVNIRQGQGFALQQKLQ